MNIYKSDSALPYVYICRERDTSKFYIGSRFANKVPASEDFGKVYFTSNKYVKSNFKNFEYEILKICEDRKSAIEYEYKLIKEMKSEHMINRQAENLIRNPYQTKKHLDIQEQKCALPGCNKLHKNYRMKCCCIGHQRKYAGLKAWS